MASGQDIRITDVPFSSVPAVSATVFINDNGRLRQTDLTTIAKYSELYTAIIEAHNAGLQSLEDTKAQLEQALIDLANEKFELINTDHAENLAELTALYENSMQNINALIENGHTKLLNDIAAVDDLRASAATVCEAMFTKHTAITPTVKGNMLLENMKGSSHQKQLSGKNLANFEYRVIPSIGVTATFSNGRISVTGTATSSGGRLAMMSNDFLLKAGEYKVSHGTHTCDICLQQTDGSGSVTSVIGINVSTMNLTEDTWVCVGINVVPDITYADDIPFMIYSADITDATYEPYCGGMVSPNPDYPQAIESVGDSGWFDGELEQGYMYNGVLTSSSNWVTSKNKMPCKENDIVILEHSAKVNQLRISFYTEDSTFISQSDTTYAETAENQTNTTTAPSTAKWFDISVRNNSGISTNTTAKTVVTINGQYATRIKTVGKNLYNPNSDVYNMYANNENNVIEKSNSALAYLIKAKPNTTYLFGRNGGTKYARIGFLDKLPVVGEKALSVEYMANEALCSVTSPQNTKYILWYHSNETSIATDVFCYETTELSDTYEPYTESTITIPLTEPLRAINDVKDEIVVQNGVYGVLRRIGKYVVTTTTSVQTHKALVNGGYSHFIEIPDKKIGHDTTIFEHFTNAKNNLYDSNAIGTYTDHHTLPRLYVVTTFAETIDFKNWLIANASVIMYELATPVFEPFADQTPFYELMAYDEVTNIEIVCGDNLNPSATVMYPGTEAGALLVNAYVDSKVLNQKLDEEVELRTQQVAGIDERLAISRKVLTAGTSDVTFDNLELNDNSVFEFYASMYGIAPLTAIVNGNSVMTTWDVQEVDVEVGICVK